MSRSPLDAACLADMQHAHEAQDCRCRSPGPCVSCQCAVRDRGTLLAHVDALQAQLDKARTSQMLLLRIAWSARTQLCVQQSAASHILAWQQARVMASIGGLLLQVTAKVRAERDAARAEVERLRAPLKEFVLHACWDPDGELVQEEFDTLYDAAESALSETGGA